MFNQSVHAHTHTCAQGESKVYVVLIVPSHHMLWWSAECALCLELDAIMFCDTTHMELLRRMLKKNFQCSSLVGVYSEEEHLYGKFKCMSTNRSK